MPKASYSHRGSSTQAVRRRQSVLCSMTSFYLMLLTLEPGLVLEWLVMSELWIHLQYGRRSDVSGCELFGQSRRRLCE